MRHAPNSRKIPSRVRRAVARTLGTALVLAGVGAASAALGGCAVSEADVRRWETTERGPEKLVAVLTHDKYGWPLRAEAAMSLVRMKPRAGRRIGLDLLSTAVESLSDDARRKLVAAIAPELIRPIVATRPPKNPDGTWPPDPSVPYKDAAFALLSHEPTLLSDEKVRADVTAALIQWTQTDFDNRIENPSQRYGIEQMMRLFGAPSAKALPALITEDATKLDRIGLLIADVGDAETKERASRALVELGKRIESPEWVKKSTALVDEANKRAKAAVDEKALRVQVTKYQEQELTKVFAAMKKVGGRPVVEYCMAVASDKGRSEDRRKAALAAVEGRVDKNRKEDIDRLMSVAGAEETPDALRDLAFARLGELPKELVQARGYSLFESKRWKVRWLAASLVLKTLSPKQIAEFMRRLPDSASTKMGMTEGITYGSQLAKMEAVAGEPKPRDAVLPYLEGRSLGAKLTALGYFYGGKKADIPIVLARGADTQPVPKCDEADDCGWSCTVPKPGNPQETETKPIATVGDFAKYCVVPSMDAP